MNIIKIQVAVKLVSHQMCEINETEVSQTAPCVFR